MSRIVFKFAVGAILALAVEARAADATYEIGKTDAILTVGDKGKASVTIAARGGWHLNAEAPLTLKLAPVPGVTPDRSKFARGDLALSNETSARFDVGLVASEPGKKTIEAEAGFVICQENACRPIKEKVALVVEAVAPAKASTSKKAAKKR